MVDDISKLWATESTVSDKYDIDGITSEHPVLKIEYFVSMGLAHEDASELHHRYFREYGLALRGLVRHHEVDPLDFDEKCDGSLPLEEMIQPDPKVRALLQDIDRRKAQVWALTNAYSTHARRVLKILQLDDLIDGLIYCDYKQPNFSCKPEAEYFESALHQAAVRDRSRVYFVDDDLRNVQAAKRLGWGSCVWICETGLDVVEGGKVVSRNSGSKLEAGGVDAVIDNLLELRKEWPTLFVEEQ